jgi:hypothetical protein
VVLLHLSRDCNDPALVRGLWERELPALAGRLTIAEPRTPTVPLRLRGGVREQRTAPDA